VLHDGLTRATRRERLGASACDPDPDPDPDPEAVLEPVPVAQLAARSTQRSIRYRATEIDGGSLNVDSSPASASRTVVRS
jgi:hypothetical protein